VSETITVRGHVLKLVERIASDPDAPAEYVAAHAAAAAARKAGAL
jgi:hypothetical protein